MSNPKKVLQIIGGMDIGGAETLIMNIYRNINRDELQFDFFVNTDSGYYESEIQEMGGRIFHTKEKSKHLFKYISDLRKVLRKNKYVAVHVHSSNALAVIPIIVSRLHHIPKRFVYSHNSTGRHKILQFLFRLILCINATKFYACGDLAAKWMYGKKSKEAVIPGVPINCSDLLFDSSSHIDKKISWNAADKTVYGHIGRMTEQKNQLFLTDIFNEILKLDSDSLLVFVGKGELKKSVVQKCTVLNIMENVIFSEDVPNTGSVINGLDVLIFPSIYEGYPAVLLEAQANGLPCFISDSITEKIAVTDLIRFISLNRKPYEWAKIIIDEKNKFSINVRSDYNKQLIDHFDVKKIADNMRKDYLE